MTVATTTIWMPVLDVETQEIMSVHAQTLADQGKTDNIKQSTMIPGGVSVRRIWTTVEDAEEWIAFVEQYNPESATIVQSPSPESGDSPTNDPV